MQSKYNHGTVLSYIDYQIEIIGVAYNRLFVKKYGDVWIISDNELDMLKKMEILNEGKGIYIYIIIHL